jgi:hypothetical protein
MLSRVVPVSRSTRMMMSVSMLSRSSGAATDVSVWVHRR